MNVLFSGGFLLLVASVALAGLHKFVEAGLCVIAGSALLIAMALRIRKKMREEEAARSGSCGCPPK